MTQSGNHPDLPATLAEIVEHTRGVVAEAKRRSPNLGRPAGVEPPRGFVRRLTEVSGSGATAVIAEIKRKSPSAGWIRPGYDAPVTTDPGGSTSDASWAAQTAPETPAGPFFAPEPVARAYSQAGASAISCLTEEKFFAGHPSFIGRVRAATDLPVLRKDFLIDPWQIDETDALGADAALLIAECLPGDLLGEMVRRAVDSGLDVLLESHDLPNFERAVPYAAEHPDQVLLGVNNRDLRIMTTDLAHTQRAVELVPDPSRLVSESGIRTPGDIARLASMGVRILLVGEHLMRAENPGGALRDLLSG